VSPDKLNLFGPIFTAAEKFENFVFTLHQENISNVSRSHLAGKFENAAITELDENRKIIVKTSSSS